MSFAAGRHALAIPGPSPVPERVLNAMHRAGSDIYSGPVVENDLKLRRQLKQLAGTQANLATYIGNGHAGWEAALQNMLAPGEKALVLTSGSFGEGWAEQATAHGVDVEILDQPRDRGPLLEGLAARLAQDTAHEIRAVLVAQIDTASSIRTDIPAVRRAMGDHPALLAVDAIASIGCEEMRMDEWGVDILVGASQKGLMCAPGIALVWFSDRAAAQTRNPSPYWRWTERANGEPLWQRWGGTPPVHLIWGLNEAMDMLIETEGMAACYHRHAGLAQAVWAAFEAWGKGNPQIRCLVTEASARAHSVTAGHIPQAADLRHWCEVKAGVTLGIGLGQEPPENYLRIGHMGNVSAHNLLGVLAVMEAGMEALAIPRGTGAVEAAAKVIAELA